MSSPSFIAQYPLFASAGIFAGLVYGLLALTVWSLLRGPQHQLPVRLWTVGNLAVSVAFVTAVFAGPLPDWLAYGVSHPLLYLSLLLRTLALKLHGGQPLRIGPGIVLWAMASAGYALCLSSPDMRVRTLYNTVVIAAGTAWLAWHAGLAARAMASRSARLLAAVEWLLVAVLLIRLAALLTAPAGFQGVRQTWDFGLLLTVATLAALYGNLGYLGMVLDASRAAEARAREAQVAEAVRREAAEHTAAELSDLLDQRDRLANERIRMLHLLANDVRQPLHNASGALQAAGEVLRGARSAGVEQVVAQAAERLRRAQTVLSNMHTVLDNTLAASMLLRRREPLLRQATDLAFLGELVLGDLDEAQRARVQWQAPPAGAAAPIEPLLVRLALRNLLRNALEHGGRDGQVVLSTEIRTTARAPVLVLEVSDDGPGLSAAQQRQVEMATAADPLPERGLGLFIARQVAAAHDGHLVLADRTPRGLRAGLVLPLPGAPGPGASAQR